MPVFTSVLDAFRLITNVIRFSINNYKMYKKRGVEGRLLLPKSPYLLASNR